MQKFLSWLGGFLREDRPQSSKRLMGISCVVSGIVLSFIDSTHIEVLWALFITGGGLLGVGILRRK